MYSCIFACVYCIFSSGTDVIDESNRPIDPYAFLNECFVSFHFDRTSPPYYRPPVTYHGPSQLVVYPMFDLKGGSPTPTYQADLHWYLRKIEDVILLTLDHYGIEGNRDEINTGVWVGENKIAAVGISSSRWITTHGFALNIDPDLSAFDTSIILPCGIEGRGVTSMAEVLRAKNNDDDENQRIPSIAEVAKVVTRTMEEVFGVTIQ